MKVYEIIIQPVTGFGTPLKGDTLFGHICWQIAYDEKVAGKNLGDLLSVYHEKPFVVFSSAYPFFQKENWRSWAMRTPSLPIEWLFDLPSDKRDKIRKRKEYKNKVWMIFKKDRRFSSFREMDFCDDTELSREMNGVPNVPYSQTHPQTRNKINRLTGRTGEGFAPFVVEQTVYSSAAQLVLFAGVDPDLTEIDGIIECLKRVGETGFGKDASTGLGKFRILDKNEIDLFSMGSQNANACYTLSPSVPGKGIFTNMYFNPFTRYGKHGDVLAKSKNPFKNPVIMADEGAVLVPNDMDKLLKLPYLGSFVTGVSKAEEATVSQGYSLYIPVQVEANHD